MESIPVVLFAYARPTHLKRTLACLRKDRVPRILAFSDAPRTPADRAGVEEVRAILRAIDWTDLALVERPANLGLGVSIRTGVGEALDRYESILVFEDDLECMPGTYGYLCAALQAYRDEPAVMSVTGWTHPRITPAGIDGPYFDGRAECWTWGTWRRSWTGMDRSARELMDDCARAGIDPYRYGADLPQMAAGERRRNIWAVRWLYHHILRRGLCFRPPHSLVDHVGLGDGATNAGANFEWTISQLLPCPPLPSTWPRPVEHPDCARLWRQACGEAGLVRRVFDRLVYHRPP
jgi:hypothetical protein